MLEHKGTIIPSGLRAPLLSNTMQITRMKSHNHCRITRKMSIAALVEDKAIATIHLIQGTLECSLLVDDDI